MNKNTLTKTAQIRNKVKPMIITKNATAFITFIERVFNAEEIKEARTLDDDGLLIHSEFKIGDSIVNVLDTKEGWIFTPSLLQVYVEDSESTLRSAQELGAIMVTEPTEFYGDLFSRFKDPWDNLWWVYEYGEIHSWTNEENTGEETWSTESDPETLKNLNYIHETIMEVMKHLGSP